MAGLKGLNNVVANLNKEINKIEGGSLKGLIRSAILIRRDMEATSPKIPIDLGNLRASWFVTTSKGETPAGTSPGFKGENAGELSSGHSRTVAENKSKAQASKNPGVVLGFSANYAFIVHESVGKSFKRPGSGAKFFEASLKRNTKKILAVIQEEARIR